MNKKAIKLYDLVDLTGPKDVLNELNYIISLMTGDVDYSLLAETYADIEKVFKGDYPGYRASNTKYHDLEHTFAVALTAARLIHGAVVQGHSFSAKNILLGLMGALFHDIGFIQTESDVNGSGAKYTIGHEQRSIEFMHKYFTQKSLSPRDIQDCTHLIMCTILSLSIKEISFRCAEMELLGKIVGSADLMAQMADREYLEKLFMLFKEFKEAGLPGYGSELELLKKTEDFYKYVALQRLSVDFGGASGFMQAHFKARWGIDRDLYQESIIGNINYLKSIVHKCKKDLDCYLKYLRRGGLAQKLLG
ncbi:MAG: HD domain-containing protein [Proteobacteria bacterium]|nr:HD domain-containing protein [Pseudomonadota bacterium]